MFVTNAATPLSIKCDGFPIMVLAPNHVAKMVTPTIEVDNLLPARVKSLEVLMRFEAQKPMAIVITIYSGIKVAKADWFIIIVLVGIHDIVFYPDTTIIGVGILKIK